jgi:hypothetical protein
MAEAAGAAGLSYPEPGHAAPVFSLREQRLRARIDKLQDERNSLRVERDFWRDLCLCGGGPLPLAVVVPSVPGC